MGKNPARITTARNFATSKFAALTCTLLVATSCAAPQAEPLEPNALARSVDDRANPSAEVLLTAIALHGAPPLGLRLEATLDPESDAFWHGHAIAFDSVVRKSRRTWLAAQREEGRAGIPGKIQLSHRTEAVDDLERQNDVGATVDLIGLLGLGPAAAEHDVAARVTGVAHGELEQSVWSAVFDVDRARLRYAAAQRRDRRLNQLAGQARADQHRLEKLFERGRIPAGLIGRVRAALAAFESQRHSIATETVRAREQLGLTSGLPPHAPALDSVGESLLDRDVGMPHDVPGTADLLDVLPSLRAHRLAYALTEAQLRAAAAEWWPALRIGPQLKIRPDDVLTGGVLALELPWPSAVQAGIEASVERRTRAREAVEDALVQAATAVVARRAELLIAQEHRQTHAKVVLAESASAWRSARATLSVKEDTGAVEIWLDALELRSRGLLDEVAANENVLVRESSFREAAGLTPGLRQSPDREDDR